MSSHPIQLTCFDLGGVIVRICRTISEAIVQAGIDLRRPAVQLDGMLPGLMPITVRYQTGQIDTTRFTRELSNAMQGLYQPDELLAMHRAWICHEYPDVADVIVDLNAAGLMTACLSNTNEEHWLQITTPEYPAIAAMHHRLTSHELGLHKPDAAIYRALEKQLDIPSESILFFDDLIENIDAAIALGWNAVHIDHAGNTAAQIRVALSQYGVL